MQTKKLLGSTLALSMILPAQSFAADSLLKGLKLSGQIDLQATAANNTSDFATRAPAAGSPAAATAVNGNNDRIGDAQTRVMVSADWDLLDDVHSKVTLRKNDRTYGTAGGGANANANSQAVNGAAGVLGNTFVDQAYFKIDKVFGHVDATLGRQFYGNSGDMVVYFGPSDKALYGLPVLSIDAARFDWAAEWGGLTGLVGKITGHGVGPVSAAGNVGINDVDVRGINASFKGTDMVSGAAYVYEKVTHGNGASGASSAPGALNGQNDNLWIAGVKAKATMGAAWLSGEFAKNFGENRGNASPTLPSRNYSGWAAKLDLGAKADTPAAAVTGWGHFGYGTGDSNSRSSSNHAFTAINGDYRPGGIYGRFSNWALAANPAALGANAAAAAIGGAVTNPVAGNGTLTNRVIWGLGVKATPSACNKLTAGVSFWDYRSQTSGNPVNGLPVVGGAQAPFGGNKHIGSEVDLDLAWQHSENVSLGAGVGDFQPGGMIKNLNNGTVVSGAAATSGQPTNPALLGYFDVRVKF